MNTKNNQPHEHSFSKESLDSFGRSFTKKSNRCFHCGVDKNVDSYKKAIQNKLLRNHFENNNFYKKIVLTQSIPQNRREERLLLKQMKNKFKKEAIAHAEKVSKRFAITKETYILLFEKRVFILQNREAKRRTDIKIKAFPKATKTLYERLYKIELENLMKKMEKNK